MSYIGKKPVDFNDVTEAQTFEVTGDLSLADKIVHTGDTNTAIRFPAADTVTIETGASERLRVDSSGNVGLGRSPNYKLDAYISGTGSPAIASSNDSIVTVLQSVGSSQGNVGTLTSHPLVLIAGNSERLRVLSGGGLTFNGDTAAANALDDYEEGSWTATLSNASGTDPSSAVTATGTYTKIGNLVNVGIQMNNFNSTGASGAIQINGLPYSADVTVTARGDVMFSNSAVHAENVVNVAVYVFSTSVQFYQSQRSGGWSAVQHNAGSSRYLYFSATYNTTG